MLADPLSWRTPRRVFVNSMSDLFHEDVPNEYIAAVFGVMASARHHTFQVLTKRAERMRQWFEWIETTVQNIREQLARLPVEYQRPNEDLDLHARYCIGRADRIGARAGLTLPRLRATNTGTYQPWPLPNVWLGCSVESQKYADERIPELLRTPAAVRWVSAEPLLGPVDFRPYLHRSVEARVCPRCLFATNQDQARTPLCPNDGALLGPDVALDWIVVGGESGRGARPFELGWARSIVKQCREARVPAFVKQLGSVPVLTEPDWEPGATFCSTTNHTGLVRLRSRKGGDIEEWRERGLGDLAVRQFPEVRASAELFA